MLACSVWVGVDGCACRPVNRWVGWSGGSMSNESVSQRSLVGGARLLADGTEALVGHLAGWSTVFFLI